MRLEKALESRGDLSKSSHGMTIAFYELYMNGDDKYTKRDGKLKLMRGGDFNKGEVIDYTDEAWGFFENLSLSMDAMVANAARWLLQDNVNELMQSGVRLLSAPEVKDET